MDTTIVALAKGKVTKNALLQEIRRHEMRKLLLSEITSKKPLRTMVNIKVDDIIVVDIVHLHTIVIIRRRNDFIGSGIHLHITMITLTVIDNDRITFDKLTLVERSRTLGGKERGIIRILTLDTLHLITVLITEDEETARLLDDRIPHIIGAMQHKRVSKDLEINRL